MKHPVFTVVWFLNILYKKPTHINQPISNNKHVCKNSCSSAYVRIANKIRKWLTDLVKWTSHDGGGYLQLQYRSIKWLLNGVTQYLWLFAFMISIGCACHIKWETDNSTDYVIFPFQILQNQKISSFLFRFAATN